MNTGFHPPLSASFISNPLVNYTLYHISSLLSSEIRKNVRDSPLDAGSYRVSRIALAEDGRQRGKGTK